MTARLRIGVIGCGEISQIAHLPTLRDLPDLFEVTVLADPSRAVLDVLKQQWPDATCLTDDRDLVGRADVDAVLIANHHVDHAETTLRALAAGKHVLLEKPMCMNLEEADALLEAEAACGLVVQIGYMRRYAPALGQARARLELKRPDIRLARVHDVIGVNSIIVESTARVARRTDLGAEFRDRGRRGMARAVAIATGEDDGPKARAYQLLLGLGCHDVSAMRELLGAPLKVAHVSASGGMVTAVFDYGAFACPCVIGVDLVPRYDTYIEVFTGDEVVRVVYDTPYVLNLPARLETQSLSEPAGVSTHVSFGSRKDTFTLQWEAFHVNVAQGLKPKTSVADAREDLALFRDMIQRLN